ncbi:MAG: DUF362 domain-containing protein [Clostridiales bacterium]|nr:DUF362 domain-containing protein [Clostridiales bacterium]
MEQKIKVATSACIDYSEHNVAMAVEDILTQLGGIEQFVPNNAKVFVKVNLVREMSPDKCGTTHPEVVVALCKQLEKITPNIIVGDSCAGLYTKGMLKPVYNKCKMTEVEARTVAKLNQNFDTQTVDLGGVMISDCDIISSFIDADVVINIAKLKTHSFAGYTGAVKNLFGLIPGLVKVEMHSRFPIMSDFCNMLVDLEQFSHPKCVLHLIDGIIGMDGEGPTNGKPKFIGQLLASSDPYAVDAVALSLFQNPFDIPLMQVAAKRGCIDESLSNIDFDFDAWKANFISDFDSPPAESMDFMLNMPSFVKVLVKKYMVKRVKMDKNCRGCGKCATHCPAKAITFKKGRARVSQKNCIHCYCCQELCPFNAVRFKKPLLYKFAQRYSGVQSKKK